MLQAFCLFPLAQKSRRFCLPQLPASLASAVPLVAQRLRETMQPLRDETTRARYRAPLRFRLYVSQSSGQPRLSQLEEQNTAACDL